MIPQEREFFVGYHPSMPAGIAGVVRWAVVILLLSSAVLAFVVPKLHDTYDLARSDFRDTREFHGVLLADPAPRLVTVLPGGAGIRTYLLVGRGKSGPKIDADGLKGKHVIASGTLIYRDSGTLISVRSAEVADTNEATVPRTERSLGRVTVRGEIVDSKCYFGTMRPGYSKVHRACAARCILGGIPPVLIARDTRGAEVPFLLADSEGGAVNERIREHIAEPVEVTGEVLQRDGLLILRSDPETYRPL